MHVDNPKKINRYTKLMQIFQKLGFTCINANFSLSILL